MPITSPSALSSGPPESPDWMSACTSIMSRSVSVSLPPSPAVIVCAVSDT